MMNSDNQEVLWVNSQIKKRVAMPASITTLANSADKSHQATIWTYYTGKVDTVWCSPDRFYQSFRHYRFFLASVENPYPIPFDT
jgi:hypothetical protein